MAPMVAAILGAAALGGVYLVAKRRALNPNELPLVDPKNSPGLVSELSYGRTYQVTCMLDLSKVPVVRTTKVGSDFVKANFQGLGFNVRTEPQPLNATEAQKFSAGAPSAWTFVGQWTKTEKYISGPANPAIPSAQFYILPVA